MRWAAALITLAFAVALTTATADAQRRGGDPKLAARKNPVAANAASIKSGQALYAKNCRHCHGLRGRGDGPLAPKDPKPADLTDAKWDHGSSDGEIFAVIHDGVSADMEGYAQRMSDAEIWNVVNYLRTFAHR